MKHRIPWHAGHWGQLQVICGTSGNLSIHRDLFAQDLTEMSTEQKLAFASSCSAAFPCQVLRYATRVQIGNLAFICRGGMHTGFPANLPKVIEYSSFLRWRLLAHFFAYHEAFGAKLAFQFATRLWSMRLGSSAGVSLCLC